MENDTEIIYDDKGFKPVQKFGIVEKIEGNLFKLDTSEDWLNLNLIIRAIPEEEARE